MTKDPVLEKTKQIAKLTVEIEAIKVQFTNKRNELARLLGLPEEHQVIKHIAKKKRKKKKYWTQARREAQGKKIKAYWANKKKKGKELF